MRLPVQETKEEKEEGSRLGDSPGEIDAWLNIPVEPSGNPLQGSLLESFVATKGSAGSTEEKSHLSQLLSVRATERFVRQKMLESQGMNVAEREVSHMFKNAACILFQARTSGQAGQESSTSSTHRPSSNKVLVVGQVQSGKTASMIALTSKAIDDGINVVVVLSGKTNVLRAQTQDRFQKYFPNSADCRFVWLTNQHDIPQTFTMGKQSKTRLNFEGGFMAEAKRRQLMNGADSPSVIMLVIKKLKSSLQVFHDRILPHLPPASRMLVIDDEADDQTVVCKRYISSPELVMNNISDLLGILLRKIAVSLIRYTATPQANLFEPRNSVLFFDALWLLEPEPNNRTYAGSAFWYSNLLSSFDCLYPQTTREDHFDHFSELNKMTQEQRKCCEASAIRPIPYRDFPNYSPISSPSLQLGVFKRGVQGSLPPRFGGLKGGMKNIQREFAASLVSPRDTDGGQCQIPLSIYQALADFLLSGAVRRWRTDCAARADGGLNDNSHRIPELYFSNAKFRAMMSLSSNPSESVSIRDLLRSSWRKQPFTPVRDIRALYTVLRETTSDRQVNPNEMLLDIAFAVNEHVSGEQTVGVPPPIDLRQRTHFLLRPIEMPSDTLDPPALPAGRAPLNWIADHADMKPSVLRIADCIVNKQNLHVVVLALTSSSSDPSIGSVSCDWDVVNYAQLGERSQPIKFVVLSCDPISKQEMFWVPAASSSIHMQLAAVVALQIKPGKRSGATGKLWHSALFHHTERQVVHNSMLTVIVEAWYKLTRCVRPWLKSQSRPKTYTRDDTNQDPRLGSWNEHRTILFPETMKSIRQKQQRIDRIRAETRRTQRLTKELKKLEGTIGTLLGGMDELRQTFDQYDVQLTTGDGEHECELIKAVLTQQWKSLRVRMENRVSHREDNALLIPNLSDIAGETCYIASHTLIRRGNYPNDPIIREWKLVHFDYERLYSSTPDVPENLIMVGGNLFSRGMTLQGLCTTYYCRSANQDQADLSLQHCRWFGHRDPRDLDLMVLYLQERQAQLYVALAEHDRLLRDEINRFIRFGLDPKVDPVLLHASTVYHYPTFSFTSGARGRAAHMVRPRHQGFFHPALSPEGVAHNQQTVAAFITALEQSNTRTRDAACIGNQNHATVYEMVSVEIVKQFLLNLQAHGKSSSRAETRMDVACATLCAYLDSGVFYAQGEDVPINVAILPTRHDQPFVIRSDGTDCTLWLRGEVQTAHSIRTNIMAQPELDEHGRTEGEQQQFAAYALYDASASGGDDDKREDGEQVIVGAARNWLSYKGQAASSSPESDTDEDAFDTDEKAMDWSRPAQDLQRLSNSPILLVLHKRVFTYEHRRRTGFRTTTNDTPFLPFVQFVLPNPIIHASALSYDADGQLVDSLNHLQIKKKPKAPLPVRKETILDRTSQLCATLEDDSAYHRTRHSVVETGFVDTDVLTKARARFIPDWWRSGMSTETPLTERMRKWLREFVEQLMNDPELHDAELQCNIFIEPIIPGTNSSFWSEATIDHYTKKITEEYSTYPIALFWISRWLKMAEYHSLNEVVDDFAVLLYNATQYNSGQSRIIQQCRTIAHKLFIELRASDQEHHRSTSTITSRDESKQHEPGLESRSMRVRPLQSHHSGVNTRSRSLQY